MTDKTFRKPSSNGRLAFGIGSLVGLAVLTLLTAVGSDLIGNELGKATDPLATASAPAGVSRPSLVTEKDVYLAINGCTSFGWGEKNKTNPTFYDCEAGGITPVDLLELRAKRLYRPIAQELASAGCLLVPENRNVQDRGSRVQCTEAVPASYLDTPALNFDMQEEVDFNTCKPVAWTRFAPPKQAAGADSPAEGMAQAQEAQSGPQSDKQDRDDGAVLLSCGSALAPQYMTPLQQEAWLAQVQAEKEMRKRLARGVHLPRVEYNGINIPLPPGPSEKDMEAIAEALSAR